MSETTTSRKTLRSMTRTAIEAAARADSDAQPLSLGDLKRMKRTPQAKIIRRALALTQEEFSIRYHIPLGVLRSPQPRHGVGGLGPAGPVAGHRAGVAAHRVDVHPGVRGL